MKQSAPKLTNIDQLNPAEYNPRIITDRERAMLRASILEHGMVLPIIVQQGSNIIIGGHQRVSVLKEMVEAGAKHRDGALVSPKVWVTALECSDIQAKRLNIALNRIDGDFDEFKLGKLFESLDLMPDNDDDLFLALGFERDEVLSLIQETETPDEVADGLDNETAGIDNGFGRSITLSLEFATVEERDEAKGALRAICKPKGAMAGSLLLQAIRKGKLGKVPTGEDITE